MKRAFLATTAVAFALAANSGAQAQTTPAESTAVVDEADTSDDVVVIGTRRTDRTVTDSPSPVDIISSAELATQPSANIIDAIKNVVPSFYAGQNSISDASTFVRSPSLRGLAGDQVLVMLNGKRYNRSSLVQVYGGSDTGLGRGAQGPDISAIPSLAISNLQVLREGATAQYGSDAIAGVLNYGLRENAGIEAVGRIGQYYAGDGESYQVALNAGLKGDNWFFNATGEYYKDKQTSRGVTRPAAVNFANNFPALASQLPNFPGPVQIWGNSPADGYKFVINTAYEISDAVKLYAFGNYANTYADQSFNYRPSVTSSAPNTNGQVITFGANALFNNTFYLTPCPTGNATCPAGGFVTNGATFRFSSLYPAGFTPRFVGQTEEIYGTGGLKGSSGGFSYDLSATWARHKLALSMYNSLNASYGPLTQTRFNFGDLIQEEFNANADATYEVEVGLASALTLSAGAEYRKETYEQTAGDPQSYGVGPYAVAQRLFAPTAVAGVFTAAGTTAAQGVGASGYAGTSPQTAGAFSQKSFGAYVGAEVDISEALTVGAAGRYEHYNTFGSAWVGKVNALFKVADALSIRGSIGTGFHAPSPGQSNVSIVTTSFNNGVAFQAGTYPTSNPVARYYGATDLSPEESTNYGLGVVLEPARGLTVTVDGYQINMRDRIGLTSPFIVTAADLAAQPALLPVGIGGQVQYFTNGFRTRTRGVDVVGTWRTTLSEADLNFSVAYNYNKTDVTQFNARIIGAAQLIDAERLAPRHRVVLNAGLSLGNFSLNARGNYYGSFTSAQDYGITAATATTPARPNQVFGEKFTTDLEVGYTFDFVTFSIGAQNLTDVKPDRLRQTATINTFPLVGGGTADGQIYPRNGGPFGFNGGFYYARVRVKY